MQNPTNKVNRPCAAMPSCRPAHQKRPGNLSIPVKRVPQVQKSPRPWPPNTNNQRCLNALIVSCPETINTPNPSLHTTSSLLARCQAWPSKAVVSRPPRNLRVWAAKAFAETFCFESQDPGVEAAATLMTLTLQTLHDSDDSF